MLDEPQAEPPCEVSSRKCGTDGTQQGSQPYICGVPPLPLSRVRLLNHHCSSYLLRALGVAGRAASARLPTASTMYARIATQIPYVAMYGIGDRASTTAIKA